MISMNGYLIMAKSRNYAVRAEYARMNSYAVIIKKDSEYYFFDAAEVDANGVNTEIKELFAKAVAYYNRKVSRKKDIETIHIGGMIESDDLQDAVDNSKRHAEINADEVSHLYHSRQYKKADDDTLWYFVMSALECEVVILYYEETEIIKDAVMYTDPEEAEKRIAFLNKAAERARGEKVKRLFEFGYASKMQKKSTDKRDYIVEHEYLLKKMNVKEKKL